MRALRAQDAVQDALKEPKHASADASIARAAPDDKALAALVAVFWTGLLLAGDATAAALTKAAAVDAAAVPGTLGRADGSAPSERTRPPLAPAPSPARLALAARTHAASVCAAQRTAAL